jgi:Cofactor assembly of complex C subunit B, CCB2/CCB4
MDTMMAAKSEANRKPKDTKRTSSLSIRTNKPIHSMGALHVQRRLIFLLVLVLGLSFPGHALLSIKDNPHQSGSGNALVGISRSLQSARTHRQNSVILSAEKLGKKQGIYTRPSAAIERGSGFFFPGLEGPKVRLVFGTALLLLTAINHVLSERQLALGNTFSEGLAVFYALLVLLQGAVEFRKEGLQRGVLTVEEGDEAAADGKVKSYQQRWSIPVEDVNWKEGVEWAASTYLALTPATHMLLVGPGKVVYSLGTTEPLTREGHEAGCIAALDTLARSKSGRVALPAQHAAVTSLTDPGYNRCVVLQRVDKQLCWVMSSDQLLAGFTKQDLQWLGQLARYVNPESS